MIDTHIHVWNFEKAEYAWLKNDTSILNRSYHLHEIEEERSAIGITGGVLVQAANNFEDTNWMLEVAADSDWINGVVAWLPLMDPQTVEKLLEEKYLRSSFFKGVRHLIHDEADPRWLLQPDVIKSLSILANHDIPYDLVGVLPQHIETALEVAHKIPALRMVFDHLNQPPSPGSENFGRWGELMSEAAKHENFFAKISGLGTAVKKGDWSAADIRPGIEFVLAHFGENRCFCGGDWPVSLLAGSYSKTWNVYKEIIDSLLTREGAGKLYLENAKKFYKLS